jgi:hypothetical protein
MITRRDLCGGDRILREYPCVLNELPFPLLRIALNYRAIPSLNPAFCDPGTIESVFENRLDLVLQISDPKMHRQALWTRDLFVSHAKGVWSCSHSPFGIHVNVLPPDPVMMWLAFFRSTLIDRAWHSKIEGRQ